jgi:anti-sigma regulatory factor (Ser/Thr protein kinase)
VSRTLLDWGLGRLIPSASLVVSELVTNSTIHAGSGVDLSISWDLEALRLTVRDNSPELPRQRFSRFDQNGRGLSVVAGLSRSFGVLPTADHGKVVWAVLNAAKPA